MDEEKRIPDVWAWGLLIAIGCAAILAVVLEAGDLLTAGALQSSSPRMKVAQGAEVTAILSDSDKARKVEICTANQHIFGWYTDYVDCETLIQVLEPHRRQITVTIPDDFMLERAAIIVRIRQDNGSLVPNTPVNEKVDLWITKS